VVVELVHKGVSDGGGPEREAVSVIFCVCVTTMVCALMVSVEVEVLVNTDELPVEVD
jgi:hypothetical protein